MSFFGFLFDSREKEKKKYVGIFLKHPQGERKPSAAGSEVVEAFSLEEARQKLHQKIVFTDEYLGDVREVK